MSEKQYTPFHIHTDISNGTTILDSVTKFQDYIDAAHSLGMTAMGFSEHGSIFEWWHKKCAVENAGMKYIHAVECYVTETLEEKQRDNYHCILIAKNLQGFYELNRLVSRSFGIDDNHCTKIPRDEDNHVYYNPRISLDELLNTSSNIIVTTACVGGILARGTESAKEKFLKFLIENKDRCFLEIQHHFDEVQIEYNKYLYQLHLKYDIPLIAGTDTHSLNKDDADCREILQKAKNIHFDGEDNFDLTFHSYDELVEIYRQQNSLPEEVYLEALENTNYMASLVENIVIDKSMKYPHIYENPVETFRLKVDEAIKNHKYIQERYSEEEIKSFRDEELQVYEKANSIDFMLLQTYLRNWEKQNGIQCGYGRGSVSGSELAYALGITEMDSKKFNLNFFRFMNPDRVSLADIDSDYGETDRAKVKKFLLEKHMDLPQIRTSEIITFNTINIKGAIREVARAYEIPLDEVSKIVKDADNDYEKAKEKYNKQYPKLFHYVELSKGVIVSIGSHPSGVLISDLNIAETVGLCTTKGSEYPVSMLNMKELDDLMYVKLSKIGWCIGNDA